MAGLTDSKIKGLKAKDKVYRVSDGDGLYLEVRTSGAKFWRYRYTLNGKASMMSLGEYLGVDKDGKPQGITLKRARELRDEKKPQVKDGIDPVAHRETAKLNTFETVALAFCEEKRTKGGWTASTHKRSVVALKARVFPVLGNRPIADITSGEILLVLEAGDKAGKSIRRELQIMIGQVFRYGVFKHLVSEDPTVVFRRGFISEPTKHSKPMSSDEVRAFFQGLEKLAAHPALIRGLELMWLTTIRRDELTGARWDEFDIDDEHGGRDAVWIIPAQRMKMKAEHRIPLVPRAVELLREIKTVSRKSEWVFPGRDDACKSIGRGGFYRAFKKISGEEFSPHCVRSTFSSWARDDGGWSDLAIEKQLAHKDRDQVRGAYDQSHQLPERRRMLMAWQRHIESVISGAGEKRKVVSIR
jgi:integrase